MTCRGKKASLALSHYVFSHVSQKNHRILLKERGLCESANCGDFRSVELSQVFETCGVRSARRLSAGRAFTHSDHEGNGADHLQNEGDA